MMQRKRILTVEDMGKVIRARRKEFGYTQKEVAEFCQCGVRFISDLENGKPTIQFGLLLEVLTMLGLNLLVDSRG